MNKNLLILGLMLSSSVALHAKSYTVVSPDGGLTVTVDTDRELTWSADFNGERIIDRSPLAMDIEGVKVQPGIAPVVKKARVKAVDVTSEAPVSYKYSTVTDRCNELTLDCRGNYSVVFRAYDNGVAYRFVTDINKPRITVTDETADINFPAGTVAYWPNLYRRGYISSYEATFDNRKITDLNEELLGCLPIYFTTPGGNRVVVTDTDVADYPNMFLTGNGSDTLHASFPPVILKSEIREGTDRTEEILENAPYIAITSGKRAFPWRLFMVSADDKGLLENNLAYVLASPSVIGDTSWIRPGKISWDWWSKLNVYGVDFVAGVNTETYKYFIDFASRFGIEYILLDEGWSKGTWNITEYKPEVDVPELVRYGAEKGVGIVLWTLWNPLNEDLENIFDVYEQWGVKGVKIDFMDRADRDMVNFYDRVGKAAADRHLLVDFHGAYKPAGVQRKYPNVMTFEGVLGMEHDKDSRDVNPVHNLILPFTRMMAGPMDYTPGAVNNATREDFMINFDHPMSLGTRGQQVAIFVVYESPLQMLADSPSHFYNVPDYAAFLARIPTVWDETRAISAQIGEHLVMARRNGDTWYLAGMTDWTPRTMDVTLDFLTAPEYTMEVFRDGVNAHIQATDYKIETSTVRPGDTVSLSMAPGGGWTAILTPVKH